MTDAEFWEVERGLWLGGAAAFRRWVAAECLMVFPEPAGILTGPAILEASPAAPRWERVEFGEQPLRRDRRRGGGARLPRRGGAARRRAASGALQLDLRAARPATGGWCSTSRRPA